MEQIVKQLEQKKKEGKTFVRVVAVNKIKTIKELRAKGYICELYPFGDILVKL